MGLENENSPKGTPHILRGGRVVVLPPIERPTTRSRNKKPDTNEVVVPVPKYVYLNILNK